MTNKVRIGKKYRYEPVMFDVSHPPFNVKPGDIVIPTNLPGCPKANTMGMCYVTKDGKFAGMVCTNSLVPLTTVIPVKIRREYSH